MRSGAAAGTVGYFHETAIYGSDRELLDIVVPFLRDGEAAGEPTLVVCHERNADLLRPHVGAGVAFLPNDARYTRPAATIAAHRDTFARFVEAGAEQIRVVGDVPHPGLGVASWQQWARYEAAVNRAFDEFPLWGLCPYDSRLAPAHVLTDVLATHPHIATADGGHEANPAYVGPGHGCGVGGDNADTADLPAPDVVLVDPAPKDARRAAEHVAGQAGLEPGRVDDLALVVSELATNAAQHGRAPSTLELWGAPGEVVVAMTDSGRGPGPLTGLVPSTRRLGGHGLWLVHQLAHDVHYAQGPSSFTVRATLR